jgi:hypothetical protein
MFCEVNQIRATEKLFLELECRAIVGDVIFPASMPIMSELLQYDEGYRQTTMCKAEAVERLCGNWALASPPRLVASELAVAARRYGIGTGINASASQVLSSDRYWYQRLEHLRRLEGVYREKP